MIKKQNKILMNRKNNLMMIIKIKIKIITLNKNNKIIFKIIITNHNNQIIKKFN